MALSREEMIKQRTKLLGYLESNTWHEKDVPLHVIKRVISTLEHPIKGAIGPSGDTLLFRACRDNRKSIVDYLLARGATVFRPAMRWPNEFLMAVVGGNHGIARQLLYHGTSVDTVRGVDDLKTALYSACVSGRVDIVKMLLEYGGANPVFCIDLDHSAKDENASTDDFEACMSMIKVRPTCFHA